MIRVIPCLLLKDLRLVKTIQFKQPRYIGDPLNAVRIFNNKEVDELFFIDINSSKKGTEIKYQLLSNIASQSFMPLGYGGGIKTLEDAKKIFGLGFEKISINSQVIKDYDLLRKLSRIYGTQSIVCTIDVKKNIFGKYKVYDHSIGKITSIDPVEHAQHMEKNGAGEVILNSVDHDGMMAGYDFKLIKSVAKSVSIPVVALGGAGCLQDFSKAVKSGASAVAAGSLFVFYGPHKAVLITYPSEEELVKNGLER